MPAKILVVDDERLIRWSLSERLKKEGYQIVEAENGAIASEKFGSEMPDIVLLDLKLPDADGLTLLKEFKSQLPSTPVLIITAFSAVDSAIEAMKLGAYDYIAKPFNMDEMVLILQRTLETTALRREVSAIVSEQRQRYGLQNIIGKSKKILDILSLVRKVAKSEATTILLRGESGTGKDLLARATHYESSRAERPFMNITCTALQDTLLESELFGHERGSFTDAKTQKKGLFELADGGTVFLDEIGDMSPALQSKLLRALEDKSFKRIGGTVDIKVDVRVIAATNRNLEESIRQGKFREDLYYRLNVISITIPPLRERPEDIPLLAQYFVERFNTEFKKQVKNIEAPALKALQAYHWSGNVRELRNVIERAMLLGGSDALTTDDFLIRLGEASPIEKGAPQFKLPPQGVIIDEVEKGLIIQALERTEWNQTRAAKLLGISRDQIRYRMERFGLLKKNNKE